MTRLGLILMLALGVACGDDDTRMTDSGPGGADGGPVTFDTGPDNDSGIVLVDSGPGGTDSGPVMMDAGPVRACAMTPAPSLTELPRCSAETGMCLQACADQACVTACLMNDMTPPVTIQGQMINCQTCIGVQNVSCGSRNGCNAEWGNFSCCIADNSCMTQACVDMNCGTEFGAFQTCVQGLAPAVCAADVAMCFPAM